MTKESNNITIRAAFPFKDMQIWQRLVVGLKFENRFSLEEEPARFVSLLLDYAKEHKSVTLNSDIHLYRARINDSGTDKSAFPLTDMGAPPPQLAGHGRLNPTGIPYLYLASDKLTAISEVRPWVGCRITTAEFKLGGECTLINFSKIHFINIPAGEEFEGPEFTWRELITWMFSAPFDPRDDTAYIPTQYLAERIKGAGFDGIIYDSSLSSTGYNVTLFDKSSAKPVARELAHVNCIVVDANFKEIA